MLVQKKQSQELSQVEELPQWKRCWVVRIQSLKQVSATMLEEREGVQEVPQR